MYVKECDNSQKSKTHKILHNVGLIQKMLYQSDVRELD